MSGTIWSASRALTIIGALSVSLSAPTPAQAPADSGLIKLVLTATLAELSPELADVVLQPTAISAWRFMSPAADRQQWTAAFVEIRRILHARDATARDSAEHYLTIRDDNSSDSLHTFAVAIGYRWRCAKGQWIGWEHSFEVTAVRRRGGVWERLPEGRVVWADPGVCTT
jgi:hypothetical protein